MKQILLTLIILATLSSSGLSQKTLTQCSDSGTKDTTSVINAHQAFLISATFKRMLYLDKKVDLLTNLNEQNAVQKLKYKGIIDTHEKTISLLQEDARKNSQMLSDESRRKKKWRNATFVTSGLLLLTWGMIVYL
jgi:hypothetical protein